MGITKNPIPTRLKEARIAAKLSQKKLGVATGIDEFSASARMNQYEKGKHVPDFLTLQRISEVLEVPVAFFYSEDDILAETIVLFCKLNKNKKLKLLESLRKQSI